MNLTSTTPITPEPEKRPEAVGLNPTESVPAPSVEISQPVKPEVTATPTPEVDHLSNVATPIADNTVQAVVDPVVIDDPTDANATPIVEPEVVNEKELDKKYFKAADEAIDTLEEKPFEEEEKSEDLQIGYLKDRFGKVIKKSEE